MFRGREDELARLRESLAGGGPSIVTQTIAGLGGIGKTELAAQYTHAHLDEYELVAWIDAEDGGIGDLARLAHALGIDTADLAPPDAARAAIDWLNACTGRRWLLVLDNVPDPSTLERCCPTAGNGHVLVTTRHRGMHHHGRVLALDVLDTDAATAYLLERTGRDREREAARELAIALGELPLALAHAAAYCDSGGVSFADYQQMLQLPARELYDTNLEAFYERTVAGTWTISIQAATLQAPLAPRVLAMAAYLAPTAIPAELFEALIEDPGDIRERKRLNDALRALHTYSLIDRDPHTGVDVHRLVQKIVRDDVQARSDSGPVRDAVAALRDAFPRDADLPERWPTCERLLGHIQALAATHAAEVQPEATVLLLNRAAVYLILAGDHARAVATATTAHEISSHHVSPRHPYALRALANLAHGYAQAGRTGEAIRIQERVLAETERLLGAQHHDTLRARANLAVSYWLAGRARDAIPLQERVLADTERLLGQEHPDTLTMRANLALSYAQAGRTQDAITLHEQVLTDAERLLGPEHPHTLTMRANLAAGYLQAGRTSEAIALDERVLADRERLLGAEHPDTVTVRGHLAAAYSQAGRTDEAIALEEQVLADADRLLGPEHPDTLAARANLAASYAQAGRTSEAIAIEEQVLADRERLLGAEHPDTLTARANLAVSYREVGRTDDALGRLESVVADSERLLGGEHPDTLRARSHLAAGYWQAGRAGDAIGLQEHVVAARERVLGGEHPDTIRARETLASWRASS